MSKLNKTVLRYLTTSLMAMLALTSAGLAEICDEAVPMNAGETWRDPGGGSSGACFEIDVATPGLLLVELSTPEATTSPPRRLEYPRPSTGAQLVKDSATSSLVWFAEAGTYRMSVAAGDAALALPAFKLRTAFLPREHGFQEGSGEPSDPTVTCTSTWTLKENPDDIENPPELQATYKENPDDIENPPENPFTAPPERGRGWDVYDVSLFSSELRTALRDLCTGAEADDHGDGFLCATPLTRGTIAGEIENPWGDDADIFRFDLAGVRTVEISTDGPTDMAGELYDRFGNRLDRVTGGGEDGNFRMVRTLSPGAYFVRVAGEGFASGPYNLTVRTSLR